MNKLTVMMNCRNGEKFLKEALQSIINQSYQEWELYFFDNQSSDNSKKIFFSFNDPRLKYFYFNQYYNLGEARKYAWKEINTEYIAICDVDDISLNNRFYEQIKYLENHSQCAVLGSNVYLIDSKSKKFSEIKHKENSDFLKEKIQYEHVFNSATLMFRKSFVDKVGGYNSNFEMVNDYDLLFRLSRKFEISNLNQTLVCNRQHESNLSYVKIVKGQIELVKLQLYIFREIKKIKIKMKLSQNILLTILRIIYHSLKIKFK